MGYVDIKRNPGRRHAMWMRDTGVLVDGMDDRKGALTRRMIQVAENKSPEMQGSARRRRSSRRVGTEANTGKDSRPAIFQS